MAESLPLFPLHAVVFPAGRLPLRIFEPRYCELVKTSIRDATPFGVVPIVAGHEVRQPDETALPQLSLVGTVVTIVDWHALEHGLVGVVIEGGRRFRLGDYDVANREGLLAGEVFWLDEPVIDMDAVLRASLESLWADLCRHPQLLSLGYPAMTGQDAGLLGRLLQVLPLPEPLRLQCLADFGSIDCLQRLNDWLQQQGVA